MLYNFDLELIKKDKAFICDRGKNKMREYHKAEKSNPYRNRPIG